VGKFRVFDEFEFVGVFSHFTDLKVSIPASFSDLRPIRMNSIFDSHRRSVALDATVRLFQVNLRESHLGSVALSVLVRF
jgi:hypothetical protein